MLQNGPGASGLPAVAADSGASGASGSDDWRSAETAPPDRAQGPGIMPDHCASEADVQTPTKSASGRGRPTIYAEPRFAKNDGHQPYSRFQPACGESTVNGPPSVPHSP